MQSGGHTRYELKYHFVWCPKYRKIALGGDIGHYVEKLLYEIAERYEFVIIEKAVMPDHVHIFVSAAPEVSPATIAQTIKSITAKKVFERFPGIKKILWGGALWERGYFVMSSGTGTTDEMIRKYIVDQRRAGANDKPNLFG